MKKFVISPVTRGQRLADKLMVPVMLVLRGFRTDSLQETHPWHVQRIDPKDVDLKLAVKRQGEDTTIYSGRYSFLFHAPILGGWKNYSVYEIDEANKPFFIGWIARRAQTNELIEAAVQKLPISDVRIRMLDGPPPYQTCFFAVGTSGEQVQLRQVGRGKLGDGKYLDIRLF